VGVVSCRKTRYRDEIAARIALAKIQQQDKPDRGERSAYRCPDCHRWHLTSKPPRTCPRCLAIKTSAEHVRRCIRGWTCPDCHATVARYVEGEGDLAEWEIAFLHECAPGEERG